MTMRQIASTDLLPQDEAERLGVTADALDQYDLMRAIERCDELVEQIRSVQLLHSQNLCRVANHLAADLAVEENLCGVASHAAADECEGAPDHGMRVPPIMSGLPTSDLAPWR
jgi:hypothetical protein